MAERYVSFRIGKETSLGSEVVPTENKNPFTDGTLIFAYNDKYNHVDTSEQIVDGRLYVDAAIDGNNYRFPINSECSYFLINSEDGKDFEMGNDGRPVYFSGGIPQPVKYINTAYGGTGLTSFTANRMVWTSSASALSTSGHYVDANRLAVNSETIPVNSENNLPEYNFYVNGISGFYKGHLYLTGAKASSSVSNETQIVFGTPSDNHVAISSNTKALIINPNTTETTNQIVLYLDAQSRFPSGIICGDNDTIGNINTNGDLIAAGGLSVDGTTSLGSNLNVTGSTAMQGNITITNGNPYVKFIDTENSNQVYYIQGYQGKFAFGPTFASAIQTDASGNMTLPSGATIAPREDNTGSIGSASYEWNKGFFRNVQSEDTFDLTATSNISFSSTNGIIQFNQNNAESGRFNGSGELQLNTAIRPALRGSATSGSADFAWGATYTNYLYIQDAANNYNGGIFYTTSNASTTTQPTYLIIGNAISNGTAGSRYGLIRLYASTNEYADIRTRSNPAYNKATFYLPAGEAASDSCYAVWNPNASAAVGGSGQPVYVDATGKVIGITTLTSDYGGTGVAAHTANRLVWSTSDTTIQATDNHFVNATKLAVNSIDEPTHNFYVDGTSGFTDSLHIFNEGNIIYKINRKKTGGSGWAYAPFRVIGNDDGLFASIGVYGNADEFKYMYLGTGSYDDESTNMRITTAGSISIPGGQTITPRTTATGSVGTSKYEWSEGYFRSIKSGDTLYITPASTLYLDSGSGTSIIFRPQGTTQGGFNTSGQFYLKSGASYTATLSGPNTANGTFSFPNTGGTFVTHATRGTAVGGTAKPVYIAATGRATALSATVGSSTLPVYLNSGAIAVCSTTLDVSITGNAATASAVKDYNNSTLTKFGYSTSGMAQADATWIGAWDATVSGEYRLRAVKQADLKVAYANSAGYAGYLPSSITFTPAETALTPDDVHSLIGTNGRIKRGTWYYAGNGYIANGTTAASQCPFGAIDLAGTTVIQASNGATAYTQIYITPPTANTSGAIRGEMIYYINNGSDYSPTWYRVLTDKNCNGILDSRYVNVSGDSMTGTLRLGAPYQATASSRYTYGALEIREAGRVGSAQSDIGYAPRIGFHWGGRVAASLVLSSSAQFQFRNQADDGYAPVRAGVVTATRLIATSTTDAAAASANAVGLIVGAADGAHLEFDNNEIIAKSNGTTGTVLYLNSGGTYTQLYKVCVSTDTYGSTLPSSGTTGQIFFKLV